MGSFGTAFLQNTADAANKRFAEKTAEENKVKDEQRKMYWGIAYDTTGQYSDAQKSAALEQYNKLIPGSLRKPSQKFSDIFGTLSKAAKAHAGTQQGQQTQTQPQPGAQSQQPATPPPGGAPGAAAAPPSQPTQPQTAKPDAGLPVGPKTPPPQGGVPIEANDARLQRQLHDQSQITDAQQKVELAKTSADYDFWLSKGKEVLGKDAAPRDLAEYAGSHGTKLPPVAQVKMTPVQLGMKDGQEIPSMRSTDGKYYDLRGNLLDPDAIKGEAPKASGGLPRFDGQMVALDSAKAQAKSGVKFPGVGGGDIDLDEIPPNMVLQPVSIGGKVLFMPIDPGQIHITVGNEVMATDKYHLKDIAAGGGTALGVARTGTTNTPTQVVRDNEGVPHVVGTTSQPNTPGPRLAGAPTGKQSQSSPGTPSRAVSPSTPPPPTGGGRTIAGVTPGMDKDYLQTARSVQQALTQVVGDDSNPNLKTVVSLAPDILKDKTKTDRVGKAIRMMLGGDDGLEGAHVATGASIGPVSIGLGGFGEFLKQSLNMDAQVAAKIEPEISGRP